MFELEEQLSPSFEIEETFSPGAVIKVIGVGGAGGNAVNRMVESGVKGVHFIAMNTDQQVLAKSLAGVRLQLGAKLTGGKGAGANPEVGRQAALESEEEISELLRGADMIFIAAGMGKGTGTGAAPVVAELAKRLGILTIPVVTRPFSVEGDTRLRVAEQGLAALREQADTVLIIPNDRIMSVAGRVPLREAYRQVDDTLRHAIQSISDVVALEGELNCDFNDVRTIMNAKGGIYMGVGAADGDGAASRAAQQALTNPYLENHLSQGAAGLLIAISVKDESRFSAIELDSILQSVRGVGAKDVNLIYGLAFRPSQDEDIRVTAIATGFEGAKPEPVEAKAHGLDLSQALLRARPSTRPMSLPASSEDLDVPTFLRLQIRRGLEGEAA